MFCSGEYLLVSGPIKIRLYICRYKWHYKANRATYTLWVLPCVCDSVCVCANTKTKNFTTELNRRILKPNRKVPYECIKRGRRNRNQMRRHNIQLKKSLLRKLWLKREMSLQRHNLYTYTEQPPIQTNTHIHLIQSIHTHTLTHAYNNDFKNKSIQWAWSFVAKFAMGIWCIHAMHYSRKYQIECESIFFSYWKVLRCVEFSIFLCMCVFMFIHTWLMLFFHIHRVYSSFVSLISRRTLFHLYNKFSIFSHFMSSIFNVCLVNVVVAEIQRILCMESSIFSLQKYCKLLFITLHSQGY